MAAPVAAFLLVLLAGMRGCGSLILRALLGTLRLALRVSLLPLLLALWASLLPLAPPRRASAMNAQPLSFRPLFGFVNGNAHL